MIRVLPMCLLVGVLTVPLFGQGTLDSPVGRDYPLMLETGPLVNHDATSTVRVLSKIVEVDGAQWMQIRLRDASLSKGSTIRFTGIRDGVSQEMDSNLLDEWSLRSAYFNGQAVLVEIFAAPGSTNSISMDHVFLEFTSQYRLGSCGICGPDDRFPSNEDWSFRILNVGCTGSIYTEDSCSVSAGHCAANGQTAQFRVPASSPGCGLNHPPPEDQFPITNGPSQNAGVGADWWVMSCGNNNIGQRPYERYGVLRPIASSLPPSGDVNVWGFGIDSECTRTQVQQDSNGGPITARFSTYYEFNVDITFGNSGSALMYQGEIIGIVTHCSDNCPDFATRVDQANFANGRASFCQAPDPCPGNCVDPNRYGTGTAGSGGIVPTLAWDTANGCAYLGNQDFSVTASNFLGGASGLFLVGLTNANDNSAGWLRLVNPAVIIPVTYPGVGPGNGSRTVGLGIPNNPFLVNLNIYLQFTGFDPGASNGVSATNGLHFIICQ